jgi:nitroreductase
MLEGDDPMNAVLKTIVERRSIRKYEPMQVPDEVLEQIFTAAAYSPNAGNRQTTQIVICQDTELNDHLGKINKSAFHGRISTSENNVSSDQPSIADDPSITSAFYGAPTVITLFSPNQFLYSGADCMIMANNICLAAASLGIGSCIVGRAEDIFASDLGAGLSQKWGVPDHYEAKVHITLGFPQGDYPKAKIRKFPNPIVVR